MKDKKAVPELYLVTNIYASVLKNVLSILIILFGFWFNFQYIGGNNFVDILLIVLFFYSIYSMSRVKRFNNKKDLINYLKNE